MINKSKQPTNRYSIHRNGQLFMDIIQEVLSIGGVRVTSANKLNIVFANLTKDQAKTLESKGYYIKCIDQVKLGVQCTKTRIKINEILGHS